MFWPDNPLIKWLLAFIGVLFLWGFWFSMRAMMAINEERHAAQELLKRNGLILDASSVTLQLGKHADRLAGVLLQSMLKQQGLAFARPSDALDPVLDRAARLTASARTIPNLLLLFGLIGTVVGLAFTLSSLGPQIQEAINAGNPKTVAQSLGLTLREMGGAFAGTLWGVSGAFVLQAINAFVGVQADKLAGDLDAVSLQFAPDIYPAGAEKQIASLSDLVRRSEQFLEDTQAKISETSDKFATVLQQAGSVIQTSLETLEVTSRDISKALQQASGDVRQSSEHLTGAVNAIKGHQQDFRNIYSSFSEMFDRSMKALKLHSDSELKQIRELQTAFGNTGSAIVTQIFKTSERLQEVSSDLAASRAAYQLATEDVTTSIRSGFDNLNLRLGDTLKMYTTEVNTVSSKLDGLRDAVSASQTASSSLERTLKAKDDAEHTRLKDQLHSEQTLMVATARLTTSLEQITPTVTALQDAPERLADALGERQAHLMKEYRTLQDQAEARLLRATIDTHERLETLLGPLGRMMEQISRRQETVSQDAHAHNKELMLLGRGLLDQLTQQREQLQQNFGALIEEHGSLASSITEGHLVTGERLNDLKLGLDRSDETYQGLLQQLQTLIEGELQQRAEALQGQAAWRTALEQQRDASLHLSSSLGALPSNLRTEELVRSQTQLAVSIRDLLGGLTSEVQVPQESQPA